MNLYGANWAFAHSSGTVSEVRQITETKVSGEAHSGNVSISSSTKHFNRCRVKWENGQEEFVDLSCNYSVGDKLALIFANGARITELNCATRDYKYTFPIRFFPSLRKVMPKFWSLGIISSIALFVIGASTRILAIENVGVLLFLAIVVYSIILANGLKKRNKEYMSTIK